MREARMWLLAVLGCDDTNFPAPEGGGGGTVVGDTWADVEQVFGSHCTTCHGGGNPLGGLDLETDGCAALYDAGLVVPGDSAGSVVWQRMADTGEAGPVMPPTGQAPQASIDTVAAWIDAGAVCGDTGGAR